MDSDRLRAFVEVARQGSVTRAARRLRVQQPTISHRLAALERDLGVLLFQRLGSGLALTAAGDVLLRHAAQLLAAEDTAVRETREAAGLAATRLHIGCAETPATYLLPRYLRAMRRFHPDVEVRLTVGNAARVLAVAVSGEADVALLTDREQHDMLVGETIRHDRFVAAVALDDAWSGRASVAPGELAARRVLLRETGSGTRAFVEGLFRSAGVQPAETMEVASLEALKRLAEAGIGVAVAPYLAVEREAADGRLWVLDLDAEGTRLVYCLLRHKNKLPAPGVALFRAAIGL